MIKDVLFWVIFWGVLSAVLAGLFWSVFLWWCQEKRIRRIGRCAREEGERFLKTKGLLWVSKMPGEKPEDEGFYWYKPDKDEPFSLLIYVGVDGIEGKWVVDELKHKMKKIDLSSPFGLWCGPLKPPFMSVVE